MSAAGTKPAGRKPSLFLLSVLAIWMLCWQAVAQDSGAPLATADAAMQAGRFADAAREYEAWLKTHPDSKQVLFALGLCYVQLGQPEQAVAVLRRHLKLAPESASGHAVLGIAMLDGPEAAEAKAQLETAVRLNPKQADAVEALARVSLVEGDPHKAVSLLRPLVGSGGGPAAKELLGEALTQSGQAEAAAAMFERDLQADPGSPARTYAAAAWARLKAGDQARAAEICELGMRLYPDSEIESAYLSLPAPFLAERMGARIQRLQEAPEVAELIAVGRVLIDADPAQKTRSGEIAQRMLAHAIQLAPNSASAHYNYGRALGQTSLQAALPQWEKALALDAGDELRLLIHTAIGKSKHDLADYDGAEQAFRAALEINQKLPRRSPEPALEYVRFLGLRSRPAEAEGVLRQVLSWNPLFPQARVERAKLLATNGEWQKVIEEGDFVLRNAGENQELLRAAHMLLARAYYRLKQPEKAQVHQAWLDSN